MTAKEYEIDWNGYNVWNVLPSEEFDFDPDATYYLLVEIETATGAALDSITASIYDTPDGSGGIDEATPVGTGTLSGFVDGISTEFYFKRGSNVVFNYIDEFSVSTIGSPDPIVPLMGDANNDGVVNGTIEYPVPMRVVSLRFSDCHARKYCLHA